MPLSKDRIIEQAIALLNSEGADGLTMRLLAKSLDIKAASLYWHFRDKAELCSAIAETLCARMSIPGETDPPLRFLWDYFYQLRDILLSVRDSAGIFQDAAPFAPNRATITRAVCSAFLALGVKEQQATVVSSLFHHYVLSFVADEHRSRTAAGREVCFLAESLPPRDKPLFAAPANPERQFAYGLRLLFEGLEHAR